MTAVQTAVIAVPLWVIAFMLLIIASQLKTIILNQYGSQRGQS